MIPSKELVRRYRESIGKYSYAERDCIKSIYYIMREYGARSDAVGSNWFARHEIVNMRPLTSRSQLYDGCAVLKTVHPGESGYSLPARYAGDVDQIDYNHIGLGTDQGEILDSTRTASGRDGPGISTAPINSRSWDIIGDFTDVDYSDRGNASPQTAPVQSAAEVTVMAQMMVTAPSGSTVKLRAKASAAADVVWHENVPIGTIVGVLEQGSVWSRVRTPSGKTGWMKNEFLAPPPEAQPNTPVSFETPAIDSQALVMEALALLERLNDIHRLLRERVG